MAARITQQVVDMQSQLKYKDEELVKHKEQGLSHSSLRVVQRIRCCSFHGFKTDFAQSSSNKCKNDLLKISS